MVQLADTDILTREVLDWQGAHLFHFATSSCSQKTRIFLNLKGVDWVSHEISLPKDENLTPYYLGINPRGLVPTLVLDGAVHIESNDILSVLEQRFPEPRLIPQGREAELADLLRHEDDLHLDLRTISFRFTKPGGVEVKSPAALSDYRSLGTGTVGGETDMKKAREIDFWERVAKDGFTDDAVRASAAKFRAAFEDLDRRLSGQPHALGEALSVLDIAWFIYTNRLRICGYPMARLHPHVEAWFGRLRENPAFASEVQMLPEARSAIDDYHRRLETAGESFFQVAAL